MPLLTAWMQSHDLRSFLGMDQRRAVLWEELAQRVRQADSASANKGMVRMSNGKLVPEQAKKCSDAEGTAITRKGEQRKAQQAVAIKLEQSDADYGDEPVKKKNLKAHTHCRSDWVATTRRRAMPPYR